MGPHLFECSGNANPSNFGLMSVAEWDGIPLLDVVQRLKPAPEATGVLVSGFDHIGQVSQRSIVGASWVFPLKTLEQLNPHLAVRMNGAPRMRMVYLPHPVMGKTEAEIRGYVFGNSPVTGRPVMQEVVEGLTQPLSEEDRKDAGFVRSTPRLCEPGTEEELNQKFLDNNWTDKLPVVLPTLERVAAMLKGTSRKADEIVGHHAATHFREEWTCTVEQVAGLEAQEAALRATGCSKLFAEQASSVSRREGLAGALDFVRERVG